MILFVNNHKKEVLNQNTVLELLSGLEMNAARGIAVAINNEVIPKSEWEKYLLKENDRVTIIKATQGG